MRTCFPLIITLALSSGCYGRYTAEEPGNQPSDITFGQPGDGMNGTEPTETTPPADLDSDGDGVNDDDDCAPLDPEIYPGAPDTECDGVDKNCDDSDLVATARSVSECGGVDEDGDGYLTLGFNDDGTSYVVDCNDDPLAGGASVNPGVTEVTYDGVDNDCNPATLDDDLDLDGFLLVVDCNDTDATINPVAAEVHDDGVDNDCNPLTLDASIPDPLDADGDGFDAVNLGGDDCDDTDATINPMAAEVPYDGLDQDCDGQDLDDVDCDGYGLAVDCDDEDPLVHDTCGVVFEIDVDGDGWFDDADCNDNDAAIYPGAPEIADDGLDQDCDGNDLVTVEEPEACADGFSIVSGFFIAPEGSTFNTLYGRRTGPDGEMIDDWFDDDVSWTDGSNDPANMIVLYDGDTVYFVLNACVADAGATWVVNGTYQDAEGDDHWICEGSSLTTTVASVWYGLDTQPVSVFDWGGGCDATWFQ